MARPSMSNILDLGDFMVSNLWEVTVIPGGFQFLDSNELNFRAISAEIPKRTGTPLEINIRGQKVKQPGDYEYSGTITLTLVETESNQVIHKAISAWRELVIRTDTNYQDAKQNVTSTIYINRLNRQNKPMNVGWTLYNCFITEYELGELNEEGAIIQPTITVSYDYFDDGTFIGESGEPSTTNLPGQL